MTPGVQLLIAKNGSVIFNKSYGHHTYNNKISVKNEDIYDLASITKILVSIPLIIREFESKSMNFSTSLSSLFPKTNLHEKKNIRLKIMWFILNTELVKYLNLKKLILVELM